jgi:hypothetical protein
MERRSPGERGTSGSSAKVSSGTELGERSSGNQLFKNLTCLKKSDMVDSNFFTEFQINSIDFYLNSIKFCMNSVDF